MKQNKNMLLILSLFSLCLSVSACKQPAPSSPTDSALPSISDSSSNSETSPSDENSSPSDSANSQTDTTSPEPVCEHEQFEESYVAPTKLSQGHTLHSCTSCDYTYKTDFTGVLGKEVSVDDPALSVLFIGNSYTFYNNSWDIFNNICWTEGNKVTVDQVTCGGYTLAQMNDPTNQYGAKVIDKLNKNKYDIVFMQEQSLRPAIGDEVFFYDAVRSLTEKIREKGAIPVLYETWGRKDGSNDLTTHNLTNESMTQKLIASYGAIADELGLDVSHVGTAFYDLNVNNPSLVLYDSDLSHPSAFGSYLVALTHYATIFGKSPVGVGYTYFNDASNQLLAEEAVYDAVFGESILKDEYKTSSEGVTNVISDAQLTCSEDPEIPTEWVDATYSINQGDWDVSKDENGIATFTNTLSSSTLMFKEELFKDGGEYSFDMKVDGTFTGASQQGVLYGCRNSDVVYTSKGDYHYLIGREKTGRLNGAYCDDGSFIISVPNVYQEAPMADVSKTYRVKVIADFENDRCMIYVDQQLASAIKFNRGFDGGYIGLLSGLNGLLTISNIQVNGKGLNVDIPEVVVQDAKKSGYKINSGSFEITETDGVQTIKSTAAKSTIMLKDVTLTTGSVVEFDYKNYGYTGAMCNGIIVASENADCIYTTATDHYYLVGRMKSGKIGGYYVNGTKYTWGSGGTSGPALQVMTDETKTYHIRVECDIENQSYKWYVDGEYGRELIFSNGFKGGYFGFCNGNSGTIEISNLKVDGASVTLVNE